MGRKLGYSRVSTATQARAGQSLGEQRKQLRAAGCKTIYEDVASGAEPDRRGLRQLLAAIGPGDCVIVTRLDRLARSTTLALEIANEICAKGADLDVLTMGRIDQTAIGQLLFTILSAFAAYERDCIRERTIEGKAAAKAADRNWRDGRPKTLPPMERRAAVADGLRMGWNIAGMKWGVSGRTLRRWHAAQEAARAASRPEQDN